MEIIKKFPKYSVDFVQEYILPAIIQNQTDISEVSSLDRKIPLLITSYYSGVKTTKEVLKDVIRKVQESWEIMKETEDVVSLVTLLFGGKNSNVMTEEILKDIKTSLGLDDVDEAIPYINQCIQARDRILSDEYSDFKPGSLVLDTRDNEIGL